MAFPNNNLRQTCLYWAAPIGDGRGGYSWADPVEIACRWSQTKKVISAANGLILTISVEVQVDQDLDTEGMMALKTLADLESGEFNDPKAAGGKVIKSFEKVPTIKADKFYRRAYLG